MADKGMDKILERAREMQAEHNRQLAGTKVEAQAAEGKIRGEMDGHRALTSIHIDPSLIGPDKVEAIETAVRELMNDLVGQMDEILENRFGIVDKMPSLSVEHLLGRS